MRLINAPVIALPLVAIAKAAWADTPGSGDYYGHMMGGYGFVYGPGFFGVGMMILFWAVLIGAAVLVARWLIERDHKPRKNAIDILKERLARGEIDPEECAARKKALES